MARGGSLWLTLIVMGAVFGLGGVYNSYNGGHDRVGNYIPPNPSDAPYFALGGALLVAGGLFVLRWDRAHPHPQVPLTAAQLDDMFLGPKRFYEGVPVVGGLIFSLFLLFALTAFGGSSLVGFEIVFALFGLALLLGGLWLLRWYDRMRARMRGPSEE